VTAIRAGCADKHCTECSHFEFVVIDMYL
jgi:hypothetical protein